MLPFASASLTLSSALLSSFSPLSSVALGLLPCVCAVRVCKFLPVGVSVIVWCQCRLLITNSSQSSTQNNGGDSIAGKSQMERQVLNKGPKVGWRDGLPAE